MKKIITLCTFLIMCVCLPISSQTNSVSGVIKDASGFTLPGAYATIKGTTNGTVSDLDGKYSLPNVKRGNVIVFSYIGMKNQEVTYTGQSKIDVVLSEDAFNLDEVVAVGYGTKKKSVVTGAIGSIGSEELLKSKPANAISALGGRVSGVNISSASGQPGKTPKLVIRGIGTNGDSNPLYIVDGLPTSDISYINPNDIESMEVLKDATSTAIYGARGANGVVLISTKTGKKGKTEITYDGYYGLQSIGKTCDMMDADDYIDMIKACYANDGKDEPDFVSTIEQERSYGYNTDWVDELYDTAPMQEHNVTASMGSEKASCLLSVGSLNQKGIIDNSNNDGSYYKRYNIRMNARYEANDYLTVGANLNYVYSEQGGVTEGTNAWNPIFYAYAMDPTTPVSFSDDDPWDNDNLGYASSQINWTKFWNPLAFMDVTSGWSKNHNQREFGNVFAEFKPIKGLVIKSDFGANFNNRDQRSYSPEYYHNANQNKDYNSVSQNSNYSTMWQWENTIIYDFSIGKNNISLLGGTSAQQSNSEWMSGSRNNLADEAVNNDNYWYLSAGDVSGQTNSGSGSIEHSLYSLFGRASYNYDQKYMAEFVIRRDGSSNFGPNNSYGVFPGVSFGWNVFNEDWWDVENFDVLKLRASWGQNGNESIEEFQYDAIISNQYYYNLAKAGEMGTTVTGSAPESLNNPDIKWETSEQLDLGADMAFFKGKLRSTVDYYSKSTKDLLLRPNIASIYGNTAAYQNAGEISNKGFELSISYKDNIGDVNYSVGANASYLKNNVESVGDGAPIDGGSWEHHYLTRMEVDKPIGYFRLYKKDGVFQTDEEVQKYTYVDANGDTKLTYPDAKAGDFKWSDKNGDGQITDDDRTDCGNPWPKWTLGFNLAVNYKGFDFSTLLSSKLSYKIYSTQEKLEGYGFQNLPTFYNDSWEKAGDGNDMPRLSKDDANGNYFKPSDFHLYDGSYLKISNIEVGYTFPKQLTQKVQISRARVYLSVDNLATFTSYPFGDPDVGSMSGDILETGMDYGKYPESRKTRIGLSLTF